MYLRKMINRIKENKLGFRRFNVEMPEFDVQDLLKEDGIKIQVKDSKEKSHDVIFKVSASYLEDPDGYTSTSETLSASFSCTTANGYTFKKSAYAFTPEKEGLQVDNLHAYKIKRLLSEMKASDNFHVTKPADAPKKYETFEARGGIFNNVINTCIQSLNKRLDLVQRQAEAERSQRRLQEEQIKRKIINDAFKGF